MIKSKVLLVLIIILSVFVCALIGGYVFLKISTSDEAIKTRITSALENATGGKLNVENAHFDLFKGLNLSKVKFEGKNPENLRIEAERIFIRYEPLALLRGEFLINSITIMSPELFIVREKDAIWKLLNGFKAFLDHAKLKFPTDQLRSGIIARDTDVHVFDEVIFREGSLNIENMDLFAQPFGGSLRDINIRGIVNDGFWQGFEINIDTNLATPELKLVAHLRNKFMTEALMKELPVIGEKFWKTYSPVGKFDFDCLLDFNNKNNEKKMDYNLSLEVIDAEMTYIKWPFLLKHVNGTIEYSKDGIFLKSMKGNVQNEGQESPGEVDAFFCVGNSRKKIEINIPNFNITEKLMKMIPDIGEKAWIDYDPKGNIDVTIKYESNEDKSVIDYSVEAICKGIEAKPPYIPYRLSNIVGLIKMDGDNVYFKNMSGYLLNGSRTNRTMFDGVIDLKSKEKRFTISIPNLNLTEEIIKSIPERGEDIWSKNKPTGQVDLTINYTGYKDSSKDEYLITADCKGNEFESTIFPIKISDIMGRVVIDKDNIQLKSLRGYVVTGKQFSRATCNGVIGLKNKNKKVLLNVLDLKVTKDLLDKFPELLKNERFRIAPEGWVDINLDYESNDTNQEGSYSLVIDSRGCEFKFPKLPISVSDIDARVNIEKEKLLIRKFSGTCIGGKVDGTIEVDKPLSNRDYVGELRFREIDFDELAKIFSKTQQKRSGICDLNIDFLGKGRDLKDFVAKGRFKLKEGYISEVPALLNILKLLNLSLPKKETFHSADIKYSVKDKIVNIDELEVFSDTIELGCVGTVGFDGTLDLMVVAGLNQETFSQIPLIGKYMDYVVGGVRKKLTKVQVTGTISNPKSTSVALKPFKHGIKSIFGLLSKDKEHIEDEKTTK
ncbi:MAG: AsmA-like C-terminal domain-containing protein [Candidatus Scalindua sediminis]|nr:AsmA-like C-terminal domain-containing protein [Candidatus Scalindua sediminis]